MKRWDDAGFVILLGARRGADIVVSLSPDAPGLYVGRPPASPGESPSHSRLKKLLSGAELVRMQAASLDRVLTLTWQRSRPSGSARTAELVLEWAGTRTAAILIDAETREVLDVMSPGTPRTVAGEIFRPLPPPPGAREVARNRKEFKERLTASRAECSTESRALLAASGLSPLLVEEIRALASTGRVDSEEAFERVVGKLEGEPHPVLMTPSDRAFHERGYRLVLSPMTLSARDEWVTRTFATCNEAAEAFVTEAHRSSTARQIYVEASGELRKALKKTTKLYRRLSRELRELRDPDELRRWGEILLAGLQQAERLDGEVAVPDPYREGEVVRVPIDPRLDLAGNARRYFARARKMVRSRERLTSRLAKTKEQLDHLETLELGLEDASEANTLAALVEELEECGIVARPRRRTAGPKAARRARPQRLEPRRYRLSSGAVVLAGRSARSNEELTFRIAQPDDLWFHAAASAGAHVVLRVPSGAEPSEEDIEASAATAAFFSKARRSTSTEILYTPRKNVRKIPAAPSGTVRVTGFRTVRVKPSLPPVPEQAPEKT